jgi:hypothetical protein
MVAGPRDFGLNLTNLTECAGVMLQRANEALLLWILLAKPFTEQSKINIIKILISKAGGS